MKVAMIAVLVVVAAGLGIVIWKAVRPQTPTAAAPTAELKSINSAALASHVSATDCWLAINTNVYDVTAFIASGRHPGGDAILQGCGKNATELFNTHGQIGGRAHTAMAQAMLKQYLIGTMAGN